MQDFFDEQIMWLLGAKNPPPPPFLQYFQNPLAVLRILKNLEMFPSFMFFFFFLVFFFFFGFFFFNLSIAVFYTKESISQISRSTSDGEEYIGKNRWTLQDCIFHPFTYIFRSFWH